MTFSRLFLLFGLCAGVLAPFVPESKQVIQMLASIQLILVAIFILIADKR